MNTLIPGAPLRSLSPTSIEYQSAQGASRAAKPARAARFTLDACAFYLFIRAHRTC